MNRTHNLRSRGVDLSTDIFHVGKFMINVKDKWITFNFDSSRVSLTEKNEKKILKVPKLPSTLNMAELYAWSSFWRNTEEGIRHGQVLKGTKVGQDKVEYKFLQGYRFQIPPSPTGTSKNPSTFLVEGNINRDQFVCPPNVIIKYS